MSLFRTYYSVSAQTGTKKPSLGSCCGLALRVEPGESTSAVHVSDYIEDKWTCQGLFDCAARRYSQSQILNDS